MQVSNAITNSVKVVAWSWQTQAGLDVATVSPSPDGVLVQGRLQVEWDDGPLELAYRLDCEGNWRFRRLTARTVYQGRTHGIELAWDGLQWTDQHGARDDLRDATYIDIMATPITNTLPLCHASWAPDQSRVFTMAYIRLPELTVEPVLQRYTMLAQGPDGGRRFRYETLGSTAGRTSRGTTGSGYHNQDSEFTADLELDADGLVLTYPPYWRRLAAAQALGE